MKSVWKNIIVIGYCIIFSITGLPMKTLEASAISEKEPKEISGTLEVNLNIAEDEMEKYLEGFRTRYPKVDLQYHYLNDYENDIRTRLDQNKGGDVLFVPGYMKQSEFVEYFESMGTQQELSEKYSFLEQCKVVNHVVYGLASDVYLSGLIYNRRVFDSAGITTTPTTMDEFLEDLRLIKERTDAIPFYTNYEAGWTLQYWENFPYIEMTGNSDYKGTAFLDEKNPFFPGTTHYQVYQLLYNIVAEGLSEEDPEKTDWAMSKEMLNRGEIGCMVMGSWALEQIKYAGPHGKDISFMPFPNNINGKQYATVATDYCYAINKKSENKAAAKAFIDYMLEESGYTDEHDTISIVKANPYPEVYSQFDNLIMLYNNGSTPEFARKYDALTSKLNLQDTAEIMRVIASAAGLSDETFDDIMTDWNTRWESSRTENMVDEDVTDYKTENKEVVMDYEITFSDAEKEYQKKVKKLKVGYLENMPPLQIKKEEECTGVVRDILDTITENAGLEFECIAYANTKSMLNAMKQNEIDLIACMDNSFTEADQIRFSKSYVDSMKVLISNNGHITEKTNPGRAAVVSGEKEYYYNEGKEKQSYSNLEECVQAVSKKEVDYTITNYYSGNYYTQKQKDESLKVIPMSTSISYGMAFNTDVDSRLISICNKCIYSIQDARLQMMLLKHMEIEEKITFKQFIEENFALVLGVVLLFFALIIWIILIFYREKTRHLEMQEVNAKRYQILAELSNEYIFEYDIASDTMNFDKKLEKEFRFRNNVKLSQNMEKDGSALGSFLKCFGECMDQNESKLFCMLRPYDRSGEKPQWYRMVISIVTDQKKNPIQVLGKISSAQEEVEKLEELQEIASRDKLTGILNREGFEKTRKTVMNVGNGTSISLAVLDLDNFKGVNDTLGHSGGDAALVKLAKTLDGVVGERGIVARYGGDEFVVLLIGVCKEEAERLYQKIVFRMRTSITYEQKVRRLSVSLGAVWSAGPKGYEELFDKADKELYAIKENGRNNYGLKEM